jgi:hypothetical protein
MIRIDEKQLIAIHLKEKSLSYILQLGQKGLLSKECEQLYISCNKNFSRVQK